mmetsp:Transcript_16600/g.36163  ORF Transcript_16600/g.36163 Transcript_16600/m.36163 type:complete len:294 (+) Transcript_16600:144-1025(+)
MLVLRCVALLGSIDAINKPSNRVVLYCIVWYGMVLHCIVCCFVPRPVPSRPGKTTLYARCVLASHKGRCDQRKDRCQTTTTPTTVHAVTGCTRDDRNGGNNVDVDVHRVRHLVLCFVQKGVVHSNVKFGHGSPLGFGRRENRSGGGRSKNRGVCHQRPPRRSGRLTDGRGTRTGNGRRRNQIVVVGVVAVSLVVDTIQPIVIVIVIVVVIVVDVLRLFLNDNDVQGRCRDGPPVSDIVHGLDVESVCFCCRCCCSVRCFYCLFFFVGTTKGLPQLVLGEISRVPGLVCGGSKG